MKPSSYRKPVPIFIPSPPPSPSVGCQEEAEARPPLPAHWHDVIARARNNRDNIAPAYSARPTISRRSQDGQGDRVLSDPYVILTRSDVDARELPRIGSPVYLGSAFGASRVGQHRIYRPPTPPRPASYKRPRVQGPEVEFQNAPEAPFVRRPKHVELPRRRPEGMYAWSIETGESSRHASSISLPSTEWQLAEPPTEPSTQEKGDLTWREKIKTLGVFLKKAFKEYGAIC
ncbi:hypothetical protein DFH07DRAFT_823392 [Mycena maculata]|uniref:Uncharacterized protein n=1 Tax=Mycena maculata TaxID=230809 RepID=A0AAD7NBW7_9AGAR|nr:hypothetical protein DFH07DRAFT_823392 [Mycena maculata]